MAVTVAMPLSVCKLELLTADFAVMAASRSRVLVFLAVLNKSMVPTDSTQSDSMSGLNAEYRVNAVFTFRAC